MVSVAACQTAYRTEVALVGRRYTLTSLTADRPTAVSADSDSDSGVGGLSLTCHGF